MIYAKSSIISEYIVVKEDLLNRFVDEVNEKIKEGYTTVGGVNTVIDGHKYYIQAMAKLSF